MQRKSIRGLSVYRKYHKDCGVRWSLRRLDICPNAYYNYRKADYYTQKSKVQTQVVEIYHEHSGVDGYRSTSVYLARKGFHYSPATIHEYMNKEMGLHAIVRPRKPTYMHGKPHKVFDNKLAQNFTADHAN